MNFVPRGIAARRAARGKFFGAGAEAGFAADRPGHYEQRGAARDVRESGARFQRKNRNRLEDARRTTGRTARSRTPRNRLSRARRGFESIPPRQEHGPLEPPPAIEKRVATATARAFHDAVSPPKAIGEVRRVQVRAGFAVRRSRNRMERKEAPERRNEVCVARRRCVLTPGPSAVSNAAAPNETGSKSRTAIAASPIPHQLAAKAQGDR